MRAYAAEKPKQCLEGKILFNHNMRNAMRNAMRKWFKAEKKQGRQHLKRLTERERYEFEQDAEEVEGGAEIT